MTPDALKLPQQSGERGRQLIQFVPDRRQTRDPWGVIASQPRWRACNSAITSSPPPEMELTRLSVVRSALESGRTSWCQLLDAVRIGPAADVAEVTAVQVRRVVTDLIEMVRWHHGEPNILIIFDAGYDAPRMAHLLASLPVEVLGRMRTDRVMRRPTPTLKEHSLAYPQGGRPPKHGKEFVLSARAEVSRQGPAGRRALGRVGAAGLSSAGPRRAAAVRRLVRRGDAGSCLPLRRNSDAGVRREPRPRPDSGGAPLTELPAAAVGLRPEEAPPRLQRQDGRREFSGLRHLVTAVTRLRIAKGACVEWPHDHCI